MSNVVDLESRRRDNVDCGCPHHALAALIDRVERVIATQDGELLVDGLATRSLLGDVVSTVSRALSVADGQVRP